MVSTSKSTTFHNLLQQLSDEYDLQISKARAKTAALKAELSKLQSESGKVCDNGEFFSENDEDLIIHAASSKSYGNDDVASLHSPPLEPPPVHERPSTPTLPPPAMLSESQSLTELPLGVSVASGSDSKPLDKEQVRKYSMFDSAEKYVSSTVEKAPAMLNDDVTDERSDHRVGFPISPEDGEKKKCVLFLEESDDEAPKVRGPAIKSSSSDTLGTVKTALSRISSQTNSSDASNCFSCHMIWTEPANRTRSRAFVHRATRANLDNTNTAAGLQPHFAKTVVGTTMAFNLAEINSLVVEPQQCADRLIVNPSAPKRLLWDLLGCSLIAYDIIMIPMALFDLPQNDLLVFMNWFTLLFWSLDIVASFLVGYVCSGNTIMDPVAIAKNYFRTWFFLDVTIVICDWVYNMAMQSNDTHGNSNVGDLGRFARIMRVVRTLRLVRLLKLKRLISTIQDHVDSEYFAILGDVVKLVLIMIVLSHVIACVWYAIGNAGRDGNIANWIEAHRMQDERLGMRYVTSLHWSVTQLMLEGMDIESQNIFERTFSIGTLIFGLLVFSSVVSRITNSMMQLQKMGATTYTQFWLLRRYCREHSVPKVLAARIQRFLEYACQKQEEHVQESRVTILALLSHQLRDELQYAIVIPQMNSHPLFLQISKVSDVTMHRLCRCAIERGTSAREDSVFFNAEVATKMYFVVSGEGCYRKDKVPCPVHKGDWICEAALWTPWIHVGDLYAATECDMISIDAAQFAETIKTNLLIWGLAAEYAVDYVESLNRVRKEDLSDLSEGVTPELLERIGKIFVGCEFAAAGGGGTVFFRTMSMSTLNPWRLLKSEESSNSQNEVTNLSRIVPDRMVMHGSSESS